jgi:hypothetical protein
VETRDSARSLYQKTIVKTLSFLSLSEMGEQQYCRRGVMESADGPIPKLLLIGPTFQSVSHHDAALTIIFAWSRQNHRAWLQWLVSTQLTHVALYRLIATAEAILSD